jgi:hypothetical protein
MLTSMERIRPSASDIICHGLTESTTYDGDPMSEYTHILGVAAKVIEAFAVEGIDLVALAERLP